jgi:hypothetical protein
MLKQLYDNNEMRRKKLLTDSGLVIALSHVKSIVVKRE